MTMADTGSSEPLSFLHSHRFLAEGHEHGERKSWAVIWLCGLMMIGEIVGGLLFGSIALVADGLHMSTHAGALLLAALAYTYARNHADDPRFTFGTGKLGDLAGFTSAIILAMIALLIGYEAVSRIFDPVAIHFREAILIACLGLAVNIASAWILSRGEYHGYSHGHSHNHGHDDHEEQQCVETSRGAVFLEIHEDGLPPRFRLSGRTDIPLSRLDATVETERPDGTHQLFVMRDRGNYLESAEEIPEPHEFVARVHFGDEEHAVVFEEHEHAQAKALLDNNMRSAVIHVMADATVSVLVIAGLLLARVFGWIWMDPLAGFIGAGVIASWSYGLIRDTGAILLDMNPDRQMAESVRHAIESEGDMLGDLHLWRLGPGHLGAILSIITEKGRGADYYRAKLTRFRSLSHLTIQVERRST